MSRNIPNAAEIGKKGGVTTVERHGNEHMSEIAKRSVTGKKRDPEYFKNLSKMGIAARKAKKRSSIDKVADLLSGK